jgi:osmoprotectant transport system substrate-binding protein
MPAQPLPRARRRNPLAALPLAAIHGTAAQGQPADRPVVSSKIDTESALVGNVIRLALGQAGLRSTARLSLGPTRIVRTALIAGEIDLHPEYSGNAAFFRNRADGPAWRDAARAFAQAAINGRVVVRDGRLLTLDEQAHAAVHREAVRRLAG